MKRLCEGLMELSVLEESDIDFSFPSMHLVHLS